MYHVTKDGEKIKITDLSDQHLLNIVKFREKAWENAQDKIASIYNRGDWDVCSEEVQDFVEKHQMYLDEKENRNL